MALAETFSGAYPRARSSPTSPAIGPVRQRYSRAGPPGRSTWRATAASSIQGAFAVAHLQRGPNADKRPGRTETNDTWGGGASSRVVCTTHRSRVTQPRSGSFVEVAVAPAGIPNAGTVYVPTADDGTVLVVRPDGTPGTPITVGRSMAQVRVAPSGTPNAGTVYLSAASSGTVTIVRADGTPGTPITAGSYTVGIAIAP